MLETWGTLSILKLNVLHFWEMFLYRYFFIKPSLCFSIISLVRCEISRIDPSISQSFPFYCSFLSLYFISFRRDLPSTFDLFYTFATLILFSRSTSLFLEFFFLIKSSFYFMDPIFSLISLRVLITGVYFP